jgi:hypothetical protein
MRPPRRLAKAGSKKKLTLSESGVDGGARERILKIRFPG